MGLNYGLIEKYSILCALDAGGSCLALAELGRCGPLPLPDGGEADQAAGQPTPAGEAVQVGF